jgi:hypothetical protein
MHIQVFARFNEIAQSCGDIQGFLRGLMKAVNARRHDHRLYLKLPHAAHRNLGVSQKPSVLTQHAHGRPSARQDLAHIAITTHRW